VHDPVTQEFVNVGVAVFSPEVAFLKAICTPHYGRINRMFARIDGVRFRQVTQYVQRQIDSLGRRISTKRIEPGKAIEHLLASILPPDDSSIQFSPAGVGLSRDLEKTLMELFERYVEHYNQEDPTARPTRNDEDVWHAFRAPLERRNLLGRLAPKEITAPSYSYKFQNAWKNQVWHVYEPVSFDLAYPTSIVEKANNWVGRATSLHQSRDEFKLHLLLGEPHDQKLRGAFERAQHILNEMPGRKEFVRESEAESFADQLAREVEGHPND
jgi:hypothetical protein